MKRPNPKFVKEYEDRHGKIRRYYRRPGYPQVPLRGPIGSVEFRTDYEAAHSGKLDKSKRIGKAIPGTVDAVVLSYLHSLEFKALKATTQAVRRRIAESFREKNGSVKVVAIQPHHIKAYMAKKIDTPEAANNILKFMRSLMAHAVDIGMRPDNPATVVRKIRSKSEGFHTWEESEIAQFETHFPLGTKARLAFALLLHTGQRRSDVVKMGRQHIKDGRIEVVQEKTGTRLFIPMNAELQEAIEAYPVEHLTFFTTEFGKPFTSNGFGNWFRDRCNEAGLPAHCSAHGLRKAMARRLAEGGKSANQIAAVTGHRTLAEVSRYTRAADQVTLADEAMKTIKR